ncbi:MAG: F0F1 ATP synthase subunit B [Actinobacteria bacterium]|nr:F0F1 ATP synthase subunit B [Actinomycetota bacterium]
MHRTRLLLAAAAVVLFGFLGFARPAAAEGELSHPVEECIKQLEEANSIDVDCQKAPNPLVPETNELIWGFVGFAIVFGALAWKGLPAMKTAMNARTERIRSDLDAAEAQRTEASAILAEYQTQLADARNESARIIEEARQAADEVKQTLTAKAQADIAELRARATADIESAKAQAIADLRGEVATLAIGAAEQVVERNLDRDTQVALVDAYIDQVGANR